MIRRKSYWKDTFREIKRTLGRFISLIVITALGSAAVSGILATSTDMRKIADQTYKSRNLYDIRIISTTGFTDDDISALADIPGLGVVSPSSSFDAYIYHGNETRTLRALALPGELNSLELTSGRLPENDAECVVERAVLRQLGLKIGDSISLGLDNMDDYFKVFDNSEFTITGTVVSPFFIIPYDRGNTSLGDGTLNYYIYLHPDTFVLDVYTDVYIQMEASRHMDNLTEEYYRAADEWTALVELTGNERVSVKEDEFTDAQTEIDDGWQEYYDGIKELEEKVADGRKELDDAKLELEDAYTELTDAESELEDALIKLADAETELRDGHVTLDKEIADARAEIRRNEKKLEDGMVELNANRAALEAGAIELEAARGNITANLQMLESMAPYGVSPELDAQYNALFMALEQLQYKQAELDAGRAALDDAEATINDGFAQIRDARVTLEKKRSDAQAEIDDGWVEYYDGLTEAEDGRREIDDGWVEYYDGLAEWQDGLETLNKEEADAIIELADAKTELEDAQKKLDDAPAPEWYYFTREDSQAFDSYYQDTMRLEGIGYVFPIVFFIVAVLVSLTTMSRMVDEHRTQIGIYRALGYRTLRIMLQLLIYTFLAGISGGLIGVVVGSNFFPRVIFGAYLHMYDMPPIVTPIPVAISVVSVSVSVGLVMIVTAFTCQRTMRDTPAELMRPKAPASGKRVLIEKMPFIWNRLTFTQKVTARNIFRYKKRFIMTLVGVAGCTALLLTSFGLRDSLAAVSWLQYGKLAAYTSRAYVKELKTEKQRSELDSLVPGHRLYIREEAISVEGTAFLVTAIIPESAEELGDFIHLCSRKTGAVIPMTDDGILVSEKLAREVGLTVGGTLVFSLNEGPSRAVKVSGIVENYVMHHIYMSSELYAELHGTAPLYNSVLIISEASAVSSLLDNSNVRAVIHTADMLEDISDSTDALEIVAIVLIILASALAFVVLFNLTNINIIERIRELATIKVLGFYDKELSMYIYRENTLVTLMGIILGLVIGLFLHGYVLQAAEIDLLMFPRIIEPLSYVYSVLLSILFAVFVNLVMNVKLARIDMVESLKNVE